MGRGATWHPMEDVCLMKAREMVLNSLNGLPDKKMDVFWGRVRVCFDELITQEIPRVSKLVAFVGKRSVNRLSRRHGEIYKDCRVFHSFYEHVLKSMTGRAEEEILKAAEEAYYTAQVNQDTDIDKRRFGENGKALIHRFQYLECWKVVRDRLTFMNKHPEGNFNAYQSLLRQNRGAMFKGSHTAVTHAETSDKKYQSMPSIAQITRTIGQDPIVHHPAPYESVKYSRIQIPFHQPPPVSPSLPDTPPLHIDIARPSDHRPRDDSNRRIRVQNQPNIDPLERILPERLLKRLESCMQCIETKCLLSIFEDDADMRATILQDFKQKYFNQKEADEIKPVPVVNQKAPGTHKRKASVADLDRRDTAVAALNTLRNDFCPQEDDQQLR